VLGGALPLGVEALGGAGTVGGCMGAPLPWMPAPMPEASEVSEASGSEPSEASGGWMAMVVAAAWETRGTATTVASLTTALGLLLAALAVSMTLAGKASKASKASLPYGALSTSGGAGGCTTMMGALKMLRQASAAAGSSTDEDMALCEAAVPWPPEAAACMDRLQRAALWSQTIAQDSLEEASLLAPSGSSPGAAAEGETGDIASWC
jgi:hypothetical protein